MLSGYRQVQSWLWLHIYLWIAMTLWKDNGVISNSILCIFLNSGFSFSWSGCHLRPENLVCSAIWHIAGRWYRLMFFLSSLVQTWTYLTTSEFELGLPVSLSVLITLCYPHALSYINSLENYFMNKVSL